MPRLSPFDRRTKPIYLDLFWEHFGGRPYAENGKWGYTATQPTISSTPLLGSSAAVGAIVFNLQAGGGAKFVAGQRIDIGTTYQWFPFVIDSISTDQLVVLPKSPVAFPANTTQVMQAWFNDTHPPSSGALANFIALAKLSTATNGFNLIGTPGAMEVHATDANSVANVPVGWLSGNGASSGAGTWNTPAGTMTFVEWVWDATFSSPSARNGNSTYFSSTAANDGIRTIANIGVTAGTHYTLSWQAKEAANHPCNVYVVDKAVPATVIASATGTTNGIGGTSHGYADMGRRGVLQFTVPAGVTNLEIRFTASAAGTQVYIDDVRLTESRQDAIRDDYAIPDPGNDFIVLLGDSWAVGYGDQLKDQLEHRIGRTIRFRNSGVGGETTSQMLARFDRDVLAYSPAVCVLQSYTNDLVNGNTTAQIVADTTQFIDRCRREGIVPVITGVAPIGNGSLLPTAHTLNETIRQLCEAA